MKYKRIIDISWPISPDMTTYKDNKTINFSTIKTFEKNKVRDSDINMNTHTGTHVDAPSHFLAKGEPIDQVQLNSLVGTCSIIDLTHITDKIDAKALEKITIKENDIILFKTINSNLSPTKKFKSNFVYLERSAALLLAKHKVKAVGIDYLGIERNQPDHETHTILLGNHIPIIEGLRLQQVTAGTYFLCCLPLHLYGTEASPARAILLENF